MTVAHANAPMVTIRNEKRLAAPAMKNPLQKSSQGRTHNVKPGARTNGVRSHS